MNGAIERFILNCWIAQEVSKGNYTKAKILYKALEGMRDRLKKSRFNSGR